MTGTRKATTASATSKQDAAQTAAIRQAAHQTALDCQRYAARLRRKLQEANR